MTDPSKHPKADRLREQREEKYAAEQARQEKEAKANASIKQRGPKSKRNRGSDDNGNS